MKISAAVRRIFELQKAKMNAPTATVKPNITGLAPLGMKVDIGGVEKLHMFETPGDYEIRVVVSYDGRQQHSHSVTLKVMNYEEWAKLQRSLS